MYIHVFAHPTDRLLPWESTTGGNQITTCTNPEAVEAVFQLGNRAVHLLPLLAPPPAVRVDVTTAHHFVIDDATNRRATPCDETKTYFIVRH